MTEPATSKNPPQDYFDDEIDLRKYIEALLLWWREIVLISMGMAFLAGLAILALRLLPAQYEASAEVAIVRVQSDVTFDEKFTTTSDEQSTTTNAAARRSALINLVKSDAVAQKVIEQLGEQLDPEERDASALVEGVVVNATGTSAGKTSDSDLIQIVATANTPEKAAGIATTWAQVFVKEANATFGQTPDDLVASVITMQENTRKDYETKQATLIEFLADSQVDELSRQIARKEQVVKELQTGEQNALRSLLAQVNEARGSISQAILQAQAESETTKFEAQKQGQQELLRSYIDTQYQAQIDVFQQQYQRDLRLLTTYNNATVRLQKTLGSAEVLKSQIEAGEETIDGGTVANLQLLKLQTFTDLLERSTPPSNSAQSLPITQERIQSPADAALPSVSTTIAQPIQVDVQTFETPLQLQVNTNQTMEKTTAQKEITALIAAIQSRLDELNNKIAQLSTEMLDENHYEHLAMNRDNVGALWDAIQVQADLLKSQLTVTPTIALQSGTILTAGVSIPFLNFAELQQIATQYGNNSNLLPTAIAALEAEIRQLKSDFEQAQAKQRELVQQRDLAWSTYTTVNSKVAELTVAKAAAGSEVRFAAEAIPPREPVKGPSLILSIVGGGIAGLVLAMLYALIANGLGRTPFLKPV